MGTGTRGGAERVLGSVVLVLYMTCLLGSTQHAERQATRDNAEAALEKLVSTYWGWRLERSPEYGTKFGINDYNDRVEQYTEEAMELNVQDAERLLEEAETINERHLSLKGRISLAVLTDLLRTYISGYKYRQYGAYLPFNVLNSPLLMWRRLIALTNFDTEHDYEMALRRYRQLPTQFDQFTQLVRRAISLQTVGPAVGTKEVVEYFEKWLAAPLDSFFMDPFRNISHTIANETRRIDLRMEATDIINTTIVPAARTFLDFFTKEYLPNVRVEIGVSARPGGEAYYRACLEWHLTLNMTPNEIYDIGLQEVDRIFKNMVKIKQDSGFQGTTLSFIEYLKKNPDNFYKTEAEMLDGFRRQIRRSSSKLTDIISDPPQYPLMVREADNPYMTTGKYTEPPLDGSRPAIFMANVAQPSKIPKFSMMALTLHESVPGHHTQMSYVLRESIPNFQRAIEYRKYYAAPFNWRFYTAYVEGWALYAESLGEELGLYDEPYSLLGRYSSEMLRACRLVVDTGIHAFGWSQENAEQFLANYTMLSTGQIKNEVKRYITIPGQAVSYKIGELKIKALRKHAEERLGEDFDIRDFHRCILELGPTPLNLVEKHVMNWIEITEEANRSFRGVVSSSQTLRRADNLTICVLVQVLWSVLVYMSSRQR